MSKQKMKRTFVSILLIAMLTNTLAGCGADKKPETGDTAVTEATSESEFVTETQTETESQTDSETQTNTEVNSETSSEAEKESETTTETQKPTETPTPSEPETPVPTQSFVDCFKIMYVQPQTYFYEAPSSSAKCWTYSKNIARVVAKSEDSEWYRVYWADGYAYMKSGSLLEVPATPADAQLESSLTVVETGANGYEYVSGVAKIGGLELRAEKYGKKMAEKEIGMMKLGIYKLQYRATDGVYWDGIYEMLIEDESELSDMYDWLGQYIESLGMIPSSGGGSPSQVYMKDENGQEIKLYIVNRTAKKP